MPTSAGNLALLAAWLVTFLVHSTLWIGSAWALTRRIRGARWRERLWKGSVLGALASTVLVLGLGRTALSWRLPQPAPASPVGSPSGVMRPGVPLTVRGPEAGSRPPGPATRRKDSAGSAAPASLAWEDLARSGLGLWLLGAGLLLARWGRAHRALARDLAARRALRDGPWLEALERLRATAGVRGAVQLSVLDGLPSPIALAGREIVLPLRALTELAGEEREALLAHELAHVARRDPQWRLGLALLARLLWVQPLLRLAAERAAAAAELCSDDLAARWTRGELALARCLARVAGWLEPRPAALPITGMVARPSALVERVERLLEGRRTPRGQGLAVGLWFTVSLVALACAGPSLEGPADPAQVEQARRIAAQPAAPDEPSPQVLEALRELGYLGDSSADEPSDGPDREPGEPGETGPSRVHLGVRIEDERITRAIELADSCPEANIAFHVEPARTGKRPTSMLSATEHALEIAADGSLHCGEMPLSLPGTHDDRLLRFHLAEIARVGVPPPLELRLRASAPSAALLHVLEACAAAGLQRFTLVTEAPDGSWSSMPFALPRDAQDPAPGPSVGPVRVRLSALGEPREDGVRALLYEVEYIALDRTTGLQGPKNFTRTLQLEALGQALQQAHARAGDRRVLLDPLPGVLWQDLTPVIEATVAAGFTDITFVGQKR